MFRTAKRATFFGYLWRFTLVHVITYLAFGLIFMYLSNYFEYFSTHDSLKDYFRTSDELIVRLAVPIQVIRGGLLALALYSFRDTIVDTRGGWFKLFFLLWVLTGIGAVIAGPGSIEGFVYTRIGLIDPLIGLPEVTLQMLVFSLIFVSWESRYKKQFML